MLTLLLGWRDAESERAQSFVVAADLAEAVGEPGAHSPFRVVFAPR